MRLVGLLQMLHPGPRPHPKIKPPQLPTLLLPAANLPTLSMSVFLTACVRCHFQYWDFFPFHSRAGFTWFSLGKRIADNMFPMTGVFLRIFFFFPFCLVFSPPLSSSSSLAQLPWLCGRGDDCHFSPSVRR